MWSAYTNAALRAADITPNFALITMIDELKLLHWNAHDERAALL
jgi:hypothetical protein